MVPGGAGDRQHQHQYALSRYRELAHRAASAADARLSPVRHPARGAAGEVAARDVLSRVEEHPEGALPQALELAQRAARRARRGRMPIAWADQLRAWHDDVR